MTERRNYGITEGQGESSIAPLFQSGAIKIFAKCVWTTDRPRSRDDLDLN